MSNNLLVPSKKQLILDELIQKQLKDLPVYKKLQYSDLRRIVENIDTSIFDPNECCIWHFPDSGKNYVPDSNNNYIGFYFRKKRFALHRLLYINFVSELKDDELIKRTCVNKASCCNVNHLTKYKIKKYRENNLLPYEDTNKKYKGPKFVNDNEYIKKIDTKPIVDSIIIDFS
ncbi:hypothetical protein Hokovirus_3_73 [Hokovirus HKV1]|uniref:Uncharacterized protein n=1 Tax=Hokovirus HKV1 TaxID=1977638 RepID=A0A1V0SGE9_9VIRU|nr:hypothetical protein Hokovirus_3_73 [Hokovirus HKV1]